MILITGAAGFVGGHLIDYLLQDGVKPQDIRLILAPWDNPNTLQNLPFEIVTCDIRNLEHLRTLFGLHIDIVYHLASKTGYDGGDYNYFKDTIVDGTLNLLKVSKEKKIKKFVFFSSTGVYGLPATAGDMTAVDEFSVPQPTEGYGQAKLEAERLVKTYARSFGYLIIRPVTIFGSRDRAGLSQLIDSIKRHYFFFIGDGKNKVSYVYVKDVVKIARILQKRRLTGLTLIVSQFSPLTFLEIVNNIADELKVARPKIHIPISLGIFLSYVAKYLFLLVGLKPIFFPNRVKVILADFYFDIKVLKKYLPSYSFYSFKDALAETIPHHSH